ncbi:hypothetical protein D9M71_748620 [compost metagenome]
MNSVPMLIPVAITMPMSKRLTAPAPVAISSGITPRTIAAVVISTGRRRIAAASSTASRTDSPRSRRNWLANSTMRMPCLLIRPISVTRPTWV